MKKIKSMLPFIGVILFIVGVICICIYIVIKNTKLDVSSNTLKENDNTIIEDSLKEEVIENVTDKEEVFEEYENTQESDISTSSSTSSNSTSSSPKSSSSASSSSSNASSSSNNSTSENNANVSNSSSSENSTNTSNNSSSESTNSSSSENNTNSSSNSSSESTNSSSSNSTPTFVETKTETNVTNTNLSYGIIKVLTTTTTYDLYSDGSKKNEYTTYNYSYDYSGYNETTSSLKADAISNKSTYANQVQEVLNNTNTLRAEVASDALTLDDDLTTAAMIRAIEIAYSDEFSHTRPDGRRCFTVLSDLGIKYSTIGENIAMGSSSASYTVNTIWKNSEGHYKNIISTSFTKIGIGVVKGPNGIYYWVQIFSA